MKRHTITGLLLIWASVSLGQSFGDALNPGLVWTTGGSAPWEVTTNTTHDGIAAAQSGLVANAAESWLETSVTGPAAVNFWWKVSSLGGNALQLYIGGSLQTQITGSGGPWQLRSFYVPDGAQAVRWRFAQAGTSNVEQRGWLDEVSLSDPTPAAVLVDPTNQTVAAGETAMLVAVGGGTEPLAYQWLKGGAPVASANSSVLVISNVQSAQAGDYSLQISNALLTVTSLAATLTVTAAPPTFTVQPISQGAPVLASVTLSAAAKGTTPVSWEWYSNSTLLPGKTAATYSIASVNSNSYVGYFVVASNSEGSRTSAVATLSYSPVFSWGDNTYGQAVVPPAASNVVDVCGGDYHCLALRQDGTVLGWGANTWSGFSYNQASVPAAATNAVSIAAGTAHSLAALDNRGLLEWGQIVSIISQDMPADLTNVIGFGQGTGAQHALALRGDGSVAEWGTTNYSLQPIPGDLTNIVGVAAGAYHSLALRADGGVVSWGGDTFFEFPQVVPPSASNVVAIATGWFHNVALRADGTVIAWGRGRSSSTGVITVPASATNVVAIACGPTYSFALRRNGTFVKWGDSAPIVPSWLTNVALLASARENALAIVADGPPRFSGPLADRSVTAGSNAFFYARAVGATPLSWQWQIDGRNISDATNAWLAVSNVQISDSGLYSVIVTNSQGAITNSGARLNVAPDVRIRLLAAIDTNGSLCLSGNGQTGLVWKLQESSDLVGWSELATLTNSNGSVNFIDPNTNQARFYRLRLVQ